MNAITNALDIANAYIADLGSQVLHNAEAIRVS